MLIKNKILIFLAILIFSIGCTQPSNNDDSDDNKTEETSEISQDEAKSTLNITNNITKNINESISSSYSGINSPMDNSCNRANTVYSYDLTIDTIINGDVTGCATFTGGMQYSFSYDNENQSYKYLYDYSLENNFDNFTNTLNSTDTIMLDGGPLTYKYSGSYDMASSRTSSTAFTGKFDYTIDGSIEIEQPDFNGTVTYENLVYTIEITANYSDGSYTYTYIYTINGKVIIGKDVYQFNNYQITLTS